MEDNNNITKKEDTLNHKPLQKLFLISRYLEEPKDKKDWFTNQFQSYVKTIKQNVFKMTKEEIYNRLKKKTHINDYSSKKLIFFPKIKNTSFKFLPKKGKNIFLQKFKKNANIANNKALTTHNEISKNNSSIFNSDILHDRTISKSIDTEFIKENAKSQKKNKINPICNLDIQTLPNIIGIENKSKYIRNNINNISEKTEILEQNLKRQEKRKYIGFKTKYNRIFNEYKKVQIDLDQYVDPNRENKYKFNLCEAGGSSGETRGENLRRLMQQISNKLKNIQNNKPSLSDIIDEVEHFKLKEKNLRDRIKKSHEKFDYLINDSSVIQKRIDNKCQKNIEI